MPEGPPAGSVSTATTGRPAPNDGGSGSPATDFSVALLREFVRLGVRDIVVAPGSRSQALALAAAEFERAGALRIHVRIDERSAGFLALGIAVETGIPAPIVTTSGTAVANLHPAVLEAHHSGVPLVLLTSDRPDEMRGIRANQTTHQSGIFGEAARLSEDVPAPGGADGEADLARQLAGRALAAATGVGTRTPGPAHLNLAFREPLSAAISLDVPLDAETASGGQNSTNGDVPGRTDAIGDVFATGLAGVEAAARADGDGESGGVAPASDSVTERVVLSAGPRTVVVAGHGAGPDAEALARAGGWPLLAEVSSGSRFGPNLVVAYRDLLAEPGWGDRIERVVVFGHPTLSREVPALVQRAGVESIVVAPTGAEWYNPGHAVTTFARTAILDAACAAQAESREARAWVGRWVVASRTLREDMDRADGAGPDVEASVSPDYRVRGGFAKSELAALRAPVTRAMLVDAVWRATWPHDRLVLAASRLIRVADARVPGKKITVHSNRGLAGIDGTVATALGIARASQAEPEVRSTGITRVLAGDLALLHDAGSLLIPPGERRPRLQLIVGNDGGGTIFDGLEVASSAPADAMDRVLYTPHDVDVAALARAYGWEYTRAATRSELERALTAPVAGVSIVEVPLSR